MNEKTGASNLERGSTKTKKHGKKSQNQTGTLGSPQKIKEGEQISLEVKAARSSLVVALNVGRPCFDFFKHLRLFVVVSSDWSSIMTLQLVANFLPRSSFCFVYSTILDFRVVVQMSHYVGIVNVNALAHDDKNN